MDMEKMEFNELVDYLTGRLIVSIGKGELHKEVAVLAMKLMDMGYQNGLTQNTKKR